jgi:hypothetical protein
MGIDQWRNLAPKKENKISEESAKEQIAKLMAYYETDLEEDPESEAAINQIMGRLLSAFMQGKLELSEDKESGELSIKQHVTKKEGKDTITYRPLKGSDKVKLDTAGTDPLRRMHCLLGILSGLGSDVIGKLSAGDIRVAEGIAGFFIMLC